MSSSRKPRSSKLGCHCRTAKTPRPSRRGVFACAFPNALAARFRTGMPESVAGPERQSKRPLWPLPDQPPYGLRSCGGPERSRRGLWRAPPPWLEDPHGDGAISLPGRLQDRRQETRTAPQRNELVTLTAPVNPRRSTGFLRPSRVSPCRSVQIGTDQAASKTTLLRPSRLAR